FLFNRLGLRPRLVWGMVRARWNDHRIYLDDLRRSVGSRYVRFSEPRPRLARIRQQDDQSKSEARQATTKSGKGCSKAVEELSSDCEMKLSERFADAHAPSPVIFAASEVSSQVHAISLAELESRPCAASRKQIVCPQQMCSAGNNFAHAAEP